MQYTIIDFFGSLKIQQFLICWKKNVILNNNFRCISERTEQLCLWLFTKNAAGASRPSLSSRTVGWHCSCCLSLAMHSCVSPSGHLSVVHSCHCQILG